MTADRKFEDWVHESLRDQYVHPETGVVVHAEDMPEELTPFEDVEGMTFGVWLTLGALAAASAAFALSGFVVFLWVESAR